MVPVGPIKISNPKKKQFETQISDPFNQCNFMHGTLTGTQFYELNQQHSSIFHAKCATEKEMGREGEREREGDRERGSARERGNQFRQKLDSNKSENFLFDSRTLQFSNGIRFERVQCRFNSRLYTNREST